MGQSIEVKIVESPMILEKEIRPCMDALIEEIAKDPGLSYWKREKYSDDPIKFFNQFHWHSYILNDGTLVIDEFVGCNYHCDEYILKLISRYSTLDFDIRAEVEGEHCCWKCENGKFRALEGRIVYE